MSRFSQTAAAKRLPEDGPGESLDEGGPDAPKRLREGGSDAPKRLREGGSRRPIRLLIVDDHPAVRALIRTVVGALADIVGECGTGTEAIAAYATHRPDVVLMDIAMPDVDGLTATRQIRAVDPNASVVIVTDYDGPDLRERAQQAGACGYVVKERLLDIQGLLKQASDT